MTYSEEESHDKGQDYLSRIRADEYTASQSRTVWMPLKKNDPDTISEDKELERLGFGSESKGKGS